MLLQTSASYKNAPQCTPVTKSISYDIYAVGNSTNYNTFCIPGNSTLCQLYQLVL